MSGEVQILLALMTAMFGGLVALSMFIFGRLSKKVDDTHGELDCLRDVVGSQAIVLSRMDEINKKMEQWYFKNIPELHEEMKALQRAQADVRVSVARMKAFRRDSSRVTHCG